MQKHWERMYRAITLTILFVTAVYTVALNGSGALIGVALLATWVLGVVTIANGYAQPRAKD